MESNEYALMDQIEFDHPWFVAKRKFLSVVLDKFRSVSGGAALDVGCGTGAVLQFLAGKGFAAYGIDPSDDALRYCESKHLLVRKSSAEKIDFPDNTFDVVFALDVLEHIHDDLGAVHEIKRILKPGGVFVSTVPAHAFLWSYHDEHLHHQRRYSKQELSDVLAKADMKVCLVSYIHAFIFLPVAAARIIKKLLGLQPKTSDVKQVGPVIKVLLSMLYNIEVSIFKWFGQLPFGMSIIAVSEKNKL